MNIGLRFREFREKKKLKQHHIADRLGLLRQDVTRMESPGSNPTWDKILNYLSALEISPAKFFESKVPDQYKNSEDRELHEKLQEILDSKDTDAAQGIAININYIHSALRSGYRQSKSDRSASTKRKQSSGEQEIFLDSGRRIRRR